MAKSSFLVVQYDLSAPSNPLLPYAITLTMPSCSCWRTTPSAPSLASVSSIKLPSSLGEAKTGAAVKAIFQPVESLFLLLSPFEALSFPR